MLFLRDPPYGNPVARLAISCAPPSTIASARARVAQFYLRQPLRSQEPRHRPGLFCAASALEPADNGECTCSGRTPRPRNRAVMPCSQGTALMRRSGSGALQRLRARLQRER